VKTTNHFHLLILKTSGAVCRELLRQDISHQKSAVRDVQALPRGTNPTR